MIKNNFKFSLSPSQQEYRQRTIARLKAEPLVLQLLKDNQLPLETVDTNSGQISLWLEQQKVCEKCTGLSFCTSSLKGRMKQLRKDSDGFLSDVFVPCRYEKKHQEQTAHRKNFRFSHMSESDYEISLRDIGSRMQDESLEYKQTMAKVSALSLGSKGYFLYGQPGTGKTYLLCAKANEMARKGYRIAFVKMPMLIQQLKQSLRDDDYRREVLNHLKYADILFLDDFGSESITPWTRDEILFPILDERMSAGRQTYFASNMTMKELLESYTTDRSASARVAAERLMDRVRALALPLRLLGTSRRRNGI